jgi:hypothetical protein
MTKKGVVLTEVLFLLGLVSVSAAALAARDFRERVPWASGVMMARGAHAKNIGFPCQVTLTERNMAKPEKASRASPEAAQQPDENTTQSVTQ